MTETLKAWGDFISSVGFPVFVSVWLLYRIDPLLRELTRAVYELTTLVREGRGKE